MESRLELHLLCNLHTENACGQRLETRFAERRHHRREAHQRTLQGKMAPDAGSEVRQTPAAETEAVDGSRAEVERGNRNAIRTTALARREVIGASRRRWSGSGKTQEQKEKQEGKQRSFTIKNIFFKASLLFNDKLALPIL